MNGWVNEWLNEWMNELMNEVLISQYAWVKIEKKRERNSMIRWTKGKMNKYVDEWQK